MKNTITLLATLLFCTSMSAQIEWGIGTKWTFNGIDHDAVPFKDLHEPFYYEITGETKINGQECFIVQSGPAEYFLFWEISDVYFYNESIDDFVLGYSFENDTNFTSAQSVYLNGQFQKEEYSVWVDTTYKEFVNGQALSVSEYSYEQSQILIEIPSPRRVFENIGFDNHSLLPYDIAGVNISTYTSGDIRCFENRGVLINFQDYPCDSIFGLTTNVNNLNVEKLAVTPNPNNGSFQIPDFKQDDAVQLIDPAGRQIQFIQKGNQFSLEQPYRGWAWVRLVRENKIHGTKMYIH